MESCGAVRGSPFDATTAPPQPVAAPPAAYSGVTIRKGRLIGRVLTKPQEVELAQRLRYRVFVETLKWVSGQDGLDTDEYDEGAIIFGVFDGEKLCGTVRIVPPQRTFMLEKSFRELLHHHHLMKMSNVIEVSRLAVDPDMTDRRQDRRTAFLLYYLVYLWMHKNHMRYLYLVSTHRFFAALRRARGAHAKTFGRQALTHDGIPYQAGLIDMHEIMDWRHKLQYLVQYLLI